MLRRMPLPALFALGALVSMVLAAGAVWQFAVPYDEMLHALLPAWIGIAAVFWVLWRQIPPSESSPADAPAQATAPPREVAALHLDRRYPDLAGIPLTALEGIAIAVETTGANPARDIPTRLAAIRIDGGEITADTFERAIDADTAGSVMEEFQAFAGASPLIGHNCAGELSMLNGIESIDNAALDTMLLSMGVFPARDDHRLNALATEFGIGAADRHSAAGDARLTAQVFLHLLPALDREGARRFGDAQDLCAYAAAR